MIIYNKVHREKPLSKKGTVKETTSLTKENIEFLKSLDLNKNKGQYGYGERTKHIRRR